jgi:hypothetical protein
MSIKKKSKGEPVPITKPNSEPFADDEEWDETFGAWVVNPKEQVRQHEEEAE